jgi:hypothetical protein
MGVKFHLVAAPPKIQRDCAVDYYCAVQCGDMLVRQSKLQGHQGVILHTGQLQGRQQGQATLNLCRLSSAI